jgi:hypothetical protein
VRHDHGDLSANQLGGKRWQPVDLVFGVAVDDRYVLAVDISGLLEALADPAYPR